MSGPGAEQTRRGEAAVEAVRSVVLGIPSGTVLSYGDVAELARTILRDFGYSTLMAQNGREALEVLESGNAIDLLFTDLIMPGGMNGIALGREAKRRRPDLKVLLTTGYAEASLERTDIGGSEFDLLNKPYRRTDLIRRVRAILDGPTGVG